MHGKLRALPVLVVAAAALAPVAEAGPVVAKPRVATIRVTSDTFLVTPLKPGAAKPDSGGVTFCCWTRRFTTRAGQKVEIDDPLMTLTGKRGTLVARNEIEFAGLARGEAVFMGTWKVLRGTGEYARVAGGGLGGGFMRPDGTTDSLFRGFLTAS